MKLRTAVIRTAGTERSRTPKAKQKTGFTPTPQRPETYRRCGTAQETPVRRSSQSGANLQREPGVTFRAFSVSGDGVCRLVGELVALVVEGLKKGRRIRAARSAGLERWAVIGQKLGEEDVCERR